MEQKIVNAKPNGNGNGQVLLNEKSRPVKVDSLDNIHSSIFDPNKYMLKLPKTKKVNLPNGQVRFEKSETDYLPVAARIAWFRKDHPYWSIITKVVQLADKAIVMKAIIKDMSGAIIATARKKETEIGFPDYIEKAETGAVGRALAMCGYGTLQAPEFDEQDRLADSPVVAKPEKLIS
ncbi:MAG TPA: hypothetical protein VGK00_01740 [Anaerolineales bacterium]|jgi:hypothetical protein